MNKKFRLTSLLLAIVMVLSITFLGGCSNSNSKDVAVTINDEEVYLNEAMYYVLFVESNYGPMTDETFWETEVEDGLTIADSAKEYIMDTYLVEINILAQEGKKAGIDITPELEPEIKAGVVEMYNALPEEIIDITGLDEQALYEISVKNYIAGEYQRSMMTDFDIDMDAVAEEYDREELKQYDTAYLHIPFTSINEDGEQVELNDSEKTDAKKTLENALAEIKEGKTFEDIKSENENIISSSESFVEGVIDAVNEEYQEAALTLENEEVTDEIIETDNGYYIIQMVNNDSEAYYNSTISNAISQKQQEKYTEKYEEIKEGYTITINEEVWDSVEVGKTTINLNTDEDIDSTEDNVDEEPEDSNDSEDETEGEE